MNIGKDNKDHKDIIAESKALVELATKKETIESFLTTSSKIIAGRVEDIQKKAEVIYDLCNAYSAWGVQEARAGGSKVGSLADNFSLLRVQVGDERRDYIDIKSCVPEIMINDCGNLVVPNDGNPTRDFVLTNDSYQIYKLITPDYTNFGMMEGLMRSARVVRTIRNYLDAAERVLDEFIAKLTKIIRTWDDEVDTILSVAIHKDDDNAQ